MHKRGLSEVASDTTPEVSEETTPEATTRAAARSTGARRRVQNAKIRRRASAVAVFCFGAGLALAIPGTPSGVESAASRHTNLPGSPEPAAAWGLGGGPASAPDGLGGNASPWRVSQGKIAVQRLTPGNPLLTGILPSASGAGTLVLDLLASGFQLSGSEQLLRPVDGPVTSVYGPRMHPYLHKPMFHTGIDFGNACGTPVRAARAGTVVTNVSSPSWGNRVIIEHDEHMRTGYAHLTESFVKDGDQVAQGQVIGLVGTTGWSTGCHLHFDVIVDGNYTDPGPYFGMTPTGAGPMPFHGSGTYSVAGAPNGDGAGDVPLPSTVPSVNATPVVPGAPLPGAPVVPTPPPSRTAPMTPTGTPSSAPSTTAPTSTPTGSPTSSPTGTPTSTPTGSPTSSPTGTPSESPSTPAPSCPTETTVGPTGTPTTTATPLPTDCPTPTITVTPTPAPSSTR